MSLQVRLHRAGGRQDGYSRLAPAETSDAEDLGPGENGDDAGDRHDR